MKKEQAKKISDFLKQYSRLQNQNYSIPEIIEDEVIRNFHNWANECEQVGTFFIKGPKISYWISLINWNQKPNEYHVVIFRENKSGPLLEIKNQKENFLTWKYVPVKRDKQNGERKEYFISRRGSLEVKIKLPDNIDQIEDFINEIFNATEFRIESDNSVSTNISDKMNEIIIKYIDFCKNSNEWNEAYKWETVRFFQENKDIETINSVGFLDKLFKVQINLINNLQYATIKKAVDTFSDQTKHIFQNLFNEETSLKERYKSFFDGFSALAVSMADRDNTTYSKPGVAEFAFFLACMYPDKYYLYREGYYHPFSDYVGEAHKKPNDEKYLHYLDLMNDFKEDYVLDNEELEIVTQKLIDKYSADKNISPPLDLLTSKNMLTQSVIYIVFKHLRDKELKDEKENKFLNIIRKYSNEDLMYFYNLIDTVFRETGILEPTNKIVLTARNNELNISIGRRYVLRLSKIENETNIGFIIPEKIQADDYEFQNPSDAYFHDTPDFNLIKNNLENIITAGKNEYKRTDKAQHAGSTNKLFERSIFDIDYRNKLLNIFDLKNMKNIPLNQILYGPPGTGKTYHTINKAIEIINPDFDTNQDREIVKKEYDRLVEEGRIVFTTFHQSMSYEDFVEGIKPETNEGKVTYDVIPGIFKQICTTASQRVNVNFKEAYQKLIKKIIENGNEYFELKTKTNKPFWVTVNRNENLTVYTSENKNNQGVMTKEKLNSFSAGKEDVFIGWEGYANGVVQKLKDDFGLSFDKKEDNTKKSFVLIIDEINRGNVSSIFGELITLIEEDKRIGRKEEIRVVLPYSKDEDNKFGVPSNLYFIGTMNTADRSVEALDTALRRRFNFVEMLPDYNVIKEKGKLENGIFDINNYEIDLAKLLQTINKRIEILLDRDHLIGHSYFLEVENEDTLKQAFSKQIIPLLQEYFYGDYGKIALVLGEGFCKGRKVQNASDIFAKTEDYDTGVFDEKIIYNLISIDNGFDIVNAVKILMKQL